MVKKRFAGEFILAPTRFPVALVHMTSSCSIRHLRTWQPLQEFERVSFLRTKCTVRSIALTGQPGGACNQTTLEVIVNRLVS